MASDIRESLAAQFYTSYVATMTSDALSLSNLRMLQNDVRVAGDRLIAYDLAQIGDDQSLPKNEGHIGIRRCETLVKAFNRFGHFSPLRSIAIKGGEEDQAEGKIHTGNRFSDAFLKQMHQCLPWEDLASCEQVSRAWCRSVLSISWENYRNDLHGLKGLADRATKSLGWAFSEGLFASLMNMEPCFTLLNNRRNDRHLERAVADFFLGHSQRCYRGQIYTKDITSIKALAEEYAGLHECSPALRRSIRACAALRLEVDSLEKMPNKNEALAGLSERLRGQGKVIAAIAVAWRIRQAEEMRNRCIDGAISDEMSHDPEFGCFLLKYNVFNLSRYVCLISLVPDSHAHLRVSELAKIRLTSEGGRTNGTR